MNTSSDSDWAKWKSVFEKHKARDLMDPNTSMFYNLAARIKQMKRLVKEFL